MDNTINEPYMLNEQTGAIPDYDDVDMKKMLKPGKLKNAGAVMDAGKDTPVVVIYEHSNFGGAKAETSNGWKDLGTWWRNKISSIEVVAGTWRFYEGPQYSGNFRDLGPGRYKWIIEQGLANDKICSFRSV